MQGVITRGLIAIHGLVRGHPQIRASLASIVNRSVGEKRVNAAILELTRPGDVVWDVGANIGIYTRRFLERVGEPGHVVAVEPVPCNAAQLRGLSAPEQLTVVEAALASSDGRVPLVVSGQSGETSSIGEGSGALTVRAARGDTLLDEGLPQPQIIKIDVEGYEGDVLDGMPAVLQGARSVIVEVHFAALARRGRPREPLQLLALLRRHGFNPRWVDSSHLVALH
ncbi:MAG: FkbM family methyltransferase [Chloroflexota bacterium]|nr:FkbM family methyltransferase [Chloroflexota bacterium]